MEIKTVDLWFGAYVLTKGCKLERVIKENDQTVVFCFLDPHRRNLEQEFISGEAMVNLTSLKASMNHIKDVMFNTLRNGKRVTTESQRARV